jgi:hypothetical protein
MTKAVAYKCCWVPKVVPESRAEAMNQEYVLALAALQRQWKPAAAA